MNTDTAPTAAPRPDPNRDVLEAQKKSWNAFSPGWAKWDDFTMRFLDDQRVALVDALRVRAGSEVLDIAAGTARA